MRARTTFQHLVHHALPPRTFCQYDFFPFDRHNLSFVVSIGEANLSSCNEALSLMKLTPANAVTKLLPSTQEWGLYSASLDESIELRNPGNDYTK